MEAGGTWGFPLLAGMGMSPQAEESERGEMRRLLGLQAGADTGTNNPGPKSQVLSTHFPSGSQRTPRGFSSHSTAACALKYLHRYPAL